MPETSHISKLYDTRSIGAAIYVIRSTRVLLDADLAKFYGVTTKALNQAVKRNAERFPVDFVFQLTPAEKQEVVTNCDHLKNLKFSKTLPFAFTEYGAVMAASVLNSPIAVQMSVFVTRAFIRMREHLLERAALATQLKAIDKKLLTHDAALLDLYEKLEPLLLPPPKPAHRIGFAKEKRAAYRTQKPTAPPRDR